MGIWQELILRTVVLFVQGSAPVVVQQAANWTSIIIAVVTGLPATIAAIVSGMILLQSRRNAEVAASTAVAVTNNIAKTDTVIEKATEIHTLTNSNLSKVQAALEVSNKTIEGLNQVQVESARRMASMEQLIASLVPSKGEQTPSQTNSAKLDHLTTMLGDVQRGTPPIPVVDEAVIKKLEEITVSTEKKLDTIQESADAAAEATKEEKPG